MAEGQAGLPGRLWRAWSRPRVVSYPVASAIYLGLLWGLTFGLFTLVTGQSSRILATFISSGVVGVLFYGPLVIWQRRRAERKASEYYDDRPIPLSGGKRS